MNSIDVLDESFLLVQTSGPAIHLARQTPGDNARPGVLPNQARRFASFEPSVLEPNWSPTTLCGRRWQQMASEQDIDDGTLVPRPEAPTCGSCLGVIDRSMPAPAPDPRLGLIADLAAGAVAEHGSAEVVGVPGDQMNALRGVIRSVLRKRFGFACRTWSHDGLLVVSSPDTRHIVERNAADVVRGLTFDGQPPRQPVDTSDWRFHWNTWATG